jgi:hypothetical protein
MRLLVKRYSLILVMMLMYTAQAQKWYQNADSLNLKRTSLALASEGVVFVSTLSALQFAWYADYQSTRFHFFNDWEGWMQMDKMGHATTAYQAGNNLYKINRWAGIKENKAIWLAGGLSYSFQFAVEMMDGFSSGWGFSNYDLLFNTVGSGLFMAQQFGWHEQRIKLKFTFWPSGLTDLPDPEGRRAKNLFGTGLHEQWLKDYNGETFWLSANIWSLAGKPNNFPKWINVALGYSVNGLLGAETNTWQFSDSPAIIRSSRPRERQFLLSLDIETENMNLPKALVWIKPIFGVVKIPFPVLEWNDKRGFAFRPLYF